MKTIVPSAAALVTLLSSSLAFAGPSPFFDRDHWTNVVGSSGSTNRVVLQAKYCKVKMLLGGSTAHKYEFRLKNTSLSGSSMQCNGGACIEHWTKTGSSWVKGSNVSSVGVSVMQPGSGHALRCTEGSLPAPSGFEWRWVGSSVNTPGHLSMADNSNLRHTRDTQPTKGYGICRVLDNGATYVGTIRYQTMSKVYKWVGSAHKYQARNFSPAKHRQTCVVNRGPKPLSTSTWDETRYHNFEYLMGDTDDSNWKNPRSQQRPPTGAIPAGTLDQGLVFPCIKWRTYRVENYVTGQNTYIQRKAFGWWREGDTKCTSPRFVPVDDYDAITSSGYQILAL